VARRVYFAFHYKDVASFRANVVRNSWVTKPDREEAGFFDESLWEHAKTDGEDAVKRLINKALEGTTVTVVLIGAETSTRKWVKYEINQSWNKDNGLIGIYIHNIKDKNEKTDVKGKDPFVELGYKGIITYDWILDKGYENLGDWVEDAYDRAQKRQKE